MQCRRRGSVVDLGEIVHVSGCLFPIEAVAGKSPELLDVGMERHS